MLEGPRRFMEDPDKMEDDKRKALAAAIEAGEIPPQLQAVVDRSNSGFLRWAHDRGKEGIVDPMPDREGAKDSRIFLESEPSLEGLSSEDVHIIGSIRPGQFLAGNQAITNDLEGLARLKRHQAALAARSYQNGTTPQRVIEGTPDVLRRHYLVGAA